MFGQLRKSLEMCSSHRCIHRTFQQLWFSCQTLQHKCFRLQQQEIRRQEEIIERLKSYNREKSLKRARSREKVLDKVELLDRPDEDETLVFRFRNGMEVES